MTPPASNISRIWRTIGTPKFLFYFIAIWVAVVMVSGIRVGDLSGYDDAAYAHEARNILHSGDWWTLNLNGNPDFDKPPLFIWLLALSFKIFGVTDFAAKVPGVLFGWATIVVVYFLAKELFPNDDEENEWLPVMAMFCLATTQYFLKYSSHAMTDVPFTFFFTLAIYLYLRGLRNGIFLLGSGLAIGAAMMMRSPMGFFPFAIIVPHLIYHRRFKTLFSFYFAGLVLLALAVPGAWYAAEYALYGDAFINRHFANLLAHSAPVAPRMPWAQFLWYFEYLFLIVKLYFPWFPLMFYGLFLIVSGLRNKSAQAGPLLIFWFLVMIVPFSLADSKVLRYILPVFPVFSILVAYTLTQLPLRSYLPVFSRVMVMALGAAAIVMAASPNFLTRGEDMRTIAPVSDAATKPGEKILLYTSGESQWNFENQLLWYGNRNSTLLKDQQKIDEILAEKKEVVVIMDKPSYVPFAEQYKTQITPLGESEKFVCFRMRSL